MSVKIEIKDKATAAMSLMDMVFTFFYRCAFAKRRHEVQKNKFL